MLILFRKETRKKFLSLAASLVHADDAIRTEKIKKKLQQFLWLQTIYWCGGALFTGCTIISLNSSRQLHFVFFAVNGWMSSISFWISCFSMLEIHYHISGFSICISLRDDNSLAAQLQAKNIQVAYWSSLEHPY